MIKERFDIGSDVKIKKDYNLELQSVEKELPDIIAKGNRISLSDNTRDISGHIAAFVAHKLQRFCGGCCKEQLVDSDATKVYSKSRCTFLQIAP